MKKRVGTAVVFLALTLLLACWPGTVIAAQADNPAPVRLYLNEERLNLQTDHLSLRQGMVFIQLYELMDLLDGSLAWQEETETVVAKWQSQKIDFRIKSDLCTVNGQTVKLNGNTFLIHNRLMVPLRSVCGILGVDLEWDDQSRIVKINVPDLLKTERLYNPAIAARIAFINHDHLFIMDGSQPGSQPILVSQKGENEIIGWSFDGQWLAYLNSPVKHSYSDEQYLWVVKADGNGAARLDSHPISNFYITNNPEWSPQENTLAYIVRESADSYDSLPGLNTASFRDGKWSINHLDVPDSSNRVFDLAWAPDGLSLAISLPATGMQGLSIKRLALTGQSTALLTMNKATRPEEPENQDPGGPGEACAMKWSPDGRYLAYYVCPPSASMTADGTELQVLDTRSPDKTIKLGCSLAYGEWLAWSGDSSQLAYIKGCGRDVMTEKKLGLVDLRNNEVKVIDCSQPGQVDVQPLWVPGSNTLLFCRGTENKDYYDHGRVGVLVPGQRIWQRTKAEEIKNLSSGSTDNADYAPTVSKDGKTLLYLHLTDLNQGSICLQTMNHDQHIDPAKIVDLSGDWAGFYGNYLPKCFSVYWIR